MTSKKKLITCGDSYMSPRVSYPGRHFSEIFASSLGFDLTTFAKGGMSNGGIALQLLEAIKRKPDLIIFNLTYATRIEFPLVQMNDNNTVSYKDMHYKHGSDELSDVYGKKGVFACDNLSVLLTPVTNENAPLPYASEKYEAAKLYFKELYVYDWKHKVDCMMMYSVIHYMHTLNIDFILFFDVLKIADSHIPYTWLSPKNDISKQIYPYIHRPIYIKPNKVWHDPGFHTSFETQKDMADFVIDHYQKYFSYDDKVN